MSKRDYVLFIEDVVNCLEKIERYTKGLSFEEFRRNDMLIDAVVRNFEIIGEAVKRIIDKRINIELTNARKIIDTRNRIIHGYDTISDDVIWGIIIKHLPKLKIEVEELMKS